MYDSPQTNPCLGKGIIITSFLLPVTLALNPGTGGNPVEEYGNRGRVDYVIQGSYARAKYGTNLLASPNAADEVRSVLDALKLPVTELAKYIGVSRTAIYDWRKGKQINADHAAKLANFAKAADVIIAANLQMSPIVRGRKLPGGMTLFEMLAGGVDGEKSAMALVTMLRDEATRREKLTAKFSGRTKHDTEGIDDAPSVYRE